MNFESKVIGAGKHLSELSGMRLMVVLSKTAWCGQPLREHSSCLLRQNNPQ